MSILGNGKASWFGIGVVVVVLGIAGCASHKSVPIHHNLAPDQLFVPINLNVNGSKTVQFPESESVNHIFESVAASGRFSRVDTQFLHWPYTLNIDYAWDQEMDFATILGTSLSAATLLLIPGYIDESHILKIEVMAGTNVVKTLVYQANSTTALSLYHMPIEDRKVVVNRLMNQAFDEIAAERLIPVLADLQPESHERKKPVGI
ncbi:MAG: hypothetical protein CME36_15825 [unclassified Hahellaceae]|nr:hypothetical protein [Hahellaceae bacterium]|tara:strand:- start:4767 stop:5381 length:615 start_codon:yes stop_codon:yes gene_type:complete